MVCISQFISQQLKTWNGKINLCGIFHPLRRPGISLIQETFFWLASNANESLISAGCQLTSGALSNDRWTHLASKPTTLISACTLPTLPNPSRTECVLTYPRSYHPTASTTLLADSATYTPSLVSLKMNLPPSQIPSRAHFTTLHYLNRCLPTSIQTSNWNIAS